MWFLKARDAESENQRVKTAHLKPSTPWRPDRRAARRRGPARNVRQQHYASGDELHAAQGRHAEAQLEVSRLEERIRFVVEGNRAEARIAELQASGASGGCERIGRSQGPELARGRADPAAEEQSQILAAQAEEQAAQAPQGEDATARRQNPRQRAARPRHQVQQQIRCWRPRAAALDEQMRSQCASGA